jgi:uncharacterized membrane protein (DUF4010 family)
VALDVYVGSGYYKNRESLQPKYLLELSAAFLFARLFVGMLFSTNVTLLNLGRRGLFVVAGVMGVTDVDPFILGLAVFAPTITPIALARGRNRRRRRELQLDYAHLCV